MSTRKSKLVVQQILLHSSGEVIFALTRGDRVVRELRSCTTWEEAGREYRKELRKVRP